MSDLDVPKVVDKSTSEIDSIIEEINASNLSAGTKKFCILCIRSACWFPRILEKKNISLSKLKALIFGKKKKSSGGSGNNGSDNTNGGDDASSNDPGGNAASAGPSNEASSSNEPLASMGSGTRKGNGRNGHHVYETAALAWHGFTELKAGDPCPNELCTGKLGLFPSGIVVRIDGQPTADVTKHIIEKLRCGLCLEVFQAPTPEELQGKQKIYTPRFIAQLAMSKFYLAVPYHRLDSYHRLLKCPLPRSTQWELIERLGGHCYAVFHVLIRLCANGKIVQNDDTIARIISLIVANKKDPSIARKGAFTTCVIGAHNEHPIALYFNGRKHSGENMEDLLSKRDADKPSILQMSDALSSNTPATIHTIACYCLSHGFRKFDELADFFPEPCLLMMEKLSAVFALDKQTRGMSDDERLVYHQTHSRPILLECHEIIEAHLEDPRVEPNGELAKALRYFKNHWVPLTRFIAIPGAPIDNNIVERALKLAIRIRKNSCFYKTPYSAEISGIILSLIYTAIYADADPVDYLCALQTYRSRVTHHPEAWLPWNYQATMTVLNLTAPVSMAPVAPPPPESLAAKQFAVGPPIVAPPL